MFGFRSERQCDEVTRRRKRARPRLGLEALETRLVPATFNVNTMAFTAAMNLKTGQDAMGQVSLLGAIQAANSLGGNNLISVPAGSYNVPDTFLGELAIDGTLTINGAGSATTVINGNGMQRVFEILDGNVTISNLSVEHGSRTERRRDHD